MRFLIIGLGSAGQRHLKNIYSIYPGSHCYALKSTNINKLINHKNQLLIDKRIEHAYKIKFLKTINEAKIIKPNFVIISSVTSKHLEHVEFLLKLDCKILIEKPLSSNWRHIDKLKKIKNIDNKVFVGFQYRFHPILNKIKNTIKKKSFGNLVSVHFYNGEYLPYMHKYENYQNGYAAVKKLGGGSLLTQIHEIDLALYFFGNPIKIFSVGGKLSNLKINVEDSVHLLMEFKRFQKKFPTSIILNFLSPLKKEIEILSDKYKITFNFKDKFYNCYNLKTLRENKIKFNFTRDDMFIAELKALVSGKNSNKLVTFNESIEGLKIIKRVKKNISV